jgi:type IV secretion system protein VirD4
MEREMETQTATNDSAKKSRNALAVGALVAVVIFHADIARLLSSFVFRVIFLAAAAAASYLIYKLAARKKINESTAHGSASLASTTDLINYNWIYELKREHQRIAEAGGFLLSRTNFKDFRRKETFSIELSRSETTQHILILGPTGTGKSRCFFLPNLRHTRGQSFIATDPKGELYEHTSGFHQSLRFAPREPDRSLCFNWIPLCQSAHITSLLARAIVVSKGESREPFWDDAEISFLSALFAHAATFESPTPAAMYDFLTSFEQEDLIEQLLNSESKIARQFIRLFQQASENVRGNTALGLGSKLNWLLDDEVRRFTSASKKVWDFSQLRTTAAGVYWILSETDVAVLKPLTSLFFTLILYSIKQRDGLPVTLYLDEMANMKIPELDSEITVLRGRNVSIVAGLQSFSQLAKVYGQHAENIFRDNFLTKIFLHGLDAETNEKCSKSLGEFTHQEETTSYSYSENRKTESRSIARNQRRLMTGDEIRRLSENEFIVIHANKKPAILAKQYYGQPPRPAQAPPPLGQVLSEDFQAAAEKLKVSRSGRRALTGVERKQLPSRGAAQLEAPRRKLLPPMPELPPELEIFDVEVIEDEE